MLETLGPLLTFCVSTSITPGPNNIMVTASGANYGFRQTLPHMFGISLGFAIMVVAMGLGLGAIFQVAPALHQTLKLVGSAYLLYLAWRIATAGRPSPEKAEATSSAGRPFTFLQAAAFQWVNPKAWVIGLGAITAFSSLELSPLANALLIAGTFSLVCFPCTAVWAGFGTAVGRWLTSHHAYRTFNLAMGVLTALSVLLIFI